MDRSPFHQAEVNARDVFEVHENKMTDGLNGHGSMLSVATSDGELGPTPGRVNLQPAGGGLPFLGAGARPNSFPP